MILLTTLWHLGELHPYEQLLAVVLAFGPFLVLFVVVAIRRRQAIAEEEAEEQAAGSPDARNSGRPSDRSS